ncbi:PLP-dependent aminotransferase family protein [Caballeronia sp. BR00000012568055]|uniref:MocR-like pyridoxine biosynthesis transcription factor PdxR n=1 Tax=Caballeronia sp. BR00000012568055 TaxID=2918761 RepID=UPI0023F70163|nr:PLP-dependent aminotransferase family protein [Caballeronia sp. BR00000012568055]
MDTIILADYLSTRLDRSRGEPMYRQVLEHMQQAILSGELPPGMKLPSSRTLALDLGIARNTVLHVYDQLTAEGYVTTTTGSGTYVADTAPREAAITRAEPDTPRKPCMISRRGERLVGHAGVSPKQWGAFMPGVPDVAEFPARTWSRLQARLWKKPNPELLTYAPGGGYRPLRRALADYLRVARSVKCAPDQIIVTTGIHQSIDLSVRLLTDVGDRAWVEDPCYWGARSVLEASGLTLAPIPVDDEGLNPSARDMEKPPRVALVTPSHQYPLGMVMSLARRRALLEFARQHSVWIIEDDYDSEFRYGSRPLSSLQGLDDAGQVIYVGSLGKMLYPGLRMGYMVVPEHLVETFRVGVAELYREGQLMQQAILTEFILDGHLTSHVRRMRGLYGERREILINAIRARFGDTLAVRGDEAGLHFVLELPGEADDRAVTAQALGAGVVTRPLVNYYMKEADARRGLMLGYACVPNEQIAPNFSKLAEVIERELTAPKQRIRQQA